MKCFLHYELITYVKPIANPMDGCFLDVVDMTKLAFTQGGDGLTKPTTPNAAIEVFWEQYQPVNKKNFFISCHAENCPQYKCYTGVVLLSELKIFKNFKTFKMFKASSGVVLLSS